MSASLTLRTNRERTSDVVIACRAIRFANVAAWGIVAQTHTTTRRARGIIHQTDYCIGIINTPIDFARSEYRAEFVALIEALKIVTTSRYRTALVFVADHVARDMMIRDAEPGGLLEVALLREACSRLITQSQAEIVILPRPRGNREAWLECVKALAEELSVDEDEIIQALSARTRKHRYSKLRKKQRRDTANTVEHYVISLRRLRERARGVRR